MKLKLFVDILKITANEINECKQKSRSAAATDKVKYIFLLIMNIMFFPVYLIPIIYSLVIVGGAFIYGPIVLLGLIFTIPFTLFILFIKLKAYPIMKANLLNGISR
ncbi:hypothetical protein [Neobacillus bataviensis]|uniref:hypothetical protein n=1 Tax=Neobacillus bataviensis TaxID=220685 RepID=UPI001CBDAFEA|nr:hypothetical protein [Neobacillus bataviensis]